VAEGSQACPLGPGLDWPGPNGAKCAYLKQLTIFKYFFYDFPKINSRLKLLRKTSFKPPFERTTACPVTAVSNGGSDVALKRDNKPPCAKAIGATARG
jgi:hypothetical protein